MSLDLSPKLPPFLPYKIYCYLFLGFYKKKISEKTKKKNIYIYIAVR
jgi:hypothetical protein